MVTLREGRLPTLWCFAGTSPPRPPGAPVSLNLQRILGNGGDQEPDPGRSSHVFQYPLQHCEKTRTTGIADSSVVLQSALGWLLALLPVKSILIGSCQVIHIDDDVAAASRVGCRILRVCHASRTASDANACRGVEHSPASVTYQRAVLQSKAFSPARDTNSCPDVVLPVELVCHEGHVAGW